MIVAAVLKDCNVLESIENNFSALPWQFHVRVYSADINLLTYYLLKTKNKASLCPLSRLTFDTCVNFSQSNNLLTRIRSRGNLVKPPASKTRVTIFMCHCRSVSVHFNKCFTHYHAGWCTHFSIIACLLKDNNKIAVILCSSDWRDWLVHNNK